MHYEACEYKLYTEDIQKDTHVYIYVNTHYMMCSDWRPFSKCLPCKSLSTGAYYRVMLSMANKCPFKTKFGVGAGDDGTDAYVW